MTDLRQAAQQALEALEEINELSIGENAICLPAEIDAAMDAIRTALAQQAEPVAWMFQHEETGRTMCVDAQQVELGFEKGNSRYRKVAPLYTAAPQKQTKPLTNEEIEKHWKKFVCAGRPNYSFARAIEAAHGIKEGT